jgi:hypothetical protein
MLRLLTLAVLALALCVGCATHMRNRELEAVAKDWSMVIRASQVIPVYPLTEDLQPGDIFLVQVPIEAQVKEYQKRGFLPLDYLIHRVNPGGYQDFYQNSFTAGDVRTPLPKTWLSPGLVTAWSVAPNASFPTYAFSVRSGGGFSLALPVQGVPVGLSLMGGDAAQGTVTIADARTYGVDTISLYQDVRHWASKNQEFLRHFAPRDHHRTPCVPERTGSSACLQNYLRVVTRVYLTGKLNVSLQSSKNIAGSASGGAPKPVDLIVTDAGSTPQQVTLETYTKNIEKLNTMLEDALKTVQLNGTAQFLPGGTVKVAAASAGSMALSETFARPLVIGYLGFDMAIGAEGMLGPPIPTHAVLEQGFRPLLMVTPVPADLQARREHASAYVKSLDPTQLDTLATSLGITTRPDVLTNLLTAIAQADSPRAFEGIAQHIKSLFNKDI